MTVTKLPTAINYFVAILVATCAHIATAADSQPIASTWLATGNWSGQNNWSPVGTVPNNAGLLHYAATVNSGVATTDIPVSLDKLTIGGGQLKLVQPLTTYELVVTGGLVGDAGKLRIDGHLVLRGGSINNTAGNPDGFYVGGDVIKRGYGIASLAPFGSNGTYDIVVEEGKYRGSNGAMAHLMGQRRSPIPNLCALSARAGK